MPTMQDIESITRDYAAKREKLSGCVTALQTEIEQLKRAALPRLRKNVAVTMEAQAELAAAIDASRDLFERPRSVVFSGIKVGLQKAPGRVEMEDPEKVVELIRKRLPGEFDRLIKVTYTPIKSAIAELTGPDMARIGCALADTTDVVLIKPSDGEVDKLVTALLKDHLDEVQE